MGGMQSAAEEWPADHPLRRDRDLCESVLDVAHAAIQRVLSSRRRTGQRGLGAEQTIVGGVSADDVLQDTFEDLLALRSATAVDNWKALAVTVAQRRAKDALRASQKHLRGTDARHELRVLSGDAQASAAAEDDGPTILDQVPASGEGPEEEAIANLNVLSLRDLARDLLDDREAKIFLEILFRQRSRRELGDELGLTPQRVGQLFKAASRRLEDHPRYPYKTTE